MGICHEFIFLSCFTVAIKGFYDMKAVNHDIHICNSVNNIFMHYILYKRRPGSFISFNDKYSVVIITLIKCYKPVSGSVCLKDLTLLGVSHLYSHWLNTTESFL